MISRKNKETINRMKRIFDEYEVKREFIDDVFFERLIHAVSENEVKTNMDSKQEVKKEKNVLDPKMEIMVNIEGIVNSKKGDTKKNKFHFGLDIGNSSRLFLAETKILLRSREYKKNDFIIFYDDTTIGTGTRGFGITRDEIVSNMSGTFKVFRFQEMDQKPEYVKGPKKDAYRLFLDDSIYDLKFKKMAKEYKTVLDVLKLLYEYGQVVKKERKKNGYR